MPIYRIFPTIESAWEAIAQIDRALNFSGTGQTWGEPIEHPYKDAALVRYRPEMLNEMALAAFHGTEEIDLEDAARRDFYIGPFPGRFGKVRAKLEEAQLLFDALSSQRSRPIVPVVRALFFSFLSTLYALREILTQVSMARDNSLKPWWRLRHAELKKNGELLQYLLFIANRDKHNASNYIGHRANIYETHIKPSQIPAGTATIRQSAEGLLAYVYPNTPKFRRIPIDGVNAEYFISLIGAPKKHLGNIVNGDDLFEAASVALEYFEKAVFDAEALEAAEVSKASAIRAPAVET